MRRRCRQTRVLDADGCLTRVKRGNRMNENIAIVAGILGGLAVGAVLALGYALLLGAVIVLLGGW
jgi:hypothetical protein